MLKNPVVTYQRPVPQHGTVKLELDERHALYLLRILSSGDRTSGNVLWRNLKSALPVTLADHAQRAPAGCTFSEFSRHMGWPNDE